MICAQFLERDMPDNNEPVMFYDGECGLCSRAIQFVIAHDQAGKIRFCALQSDRAQALLNTDKLLSPQSGTVVLLEGGKIYLRSTAVLRIGRHLRFPWRVLSRLAQICPLFVRDSVYRLIAKNRHRIPTKSACKMMTPELRSRFLDI